ncbi:hypothetical protein A2634_01220 [Candidatus Amesbacteria bacterium RIFCSPHIGHO2_01_FULL_48_32]|uniref:DUF5667 domain-containing protein n=1 Tax=Candidatus Amesbacteria bacterium RIFCSPLOWO2_01_FULL_48_25 TaxID=1797259 RepID=A0A1F4ZBL2_9BACT|nr:MAG: hypothetical protein A2634_01220 [Candidatus Amesbacteria bacterium RIFCSPHIGHO2_01_FULL_48_32]OGD03662.1 MAG: hypothetical protein A2989_03205 [Candidatus Amesbacteria bacterium RIFCSPLOWO2_01_FULL_48_25]HJZ05989.1 hypothetical protein [Patescibacteria group bacterium]
MKKLLVSVVLGLLVLPVAVGALDEEEVDGLKEQRAKLMLERRSETTAQILERLVKNMNGINSRRVAAMNRHLERMRALMEKVGAARDKAAASGKDVSAVDTAVTAADAAIASAQAAVDAQGAKVYSATTRAEFMAAKKQLATDLRGVHQRIVEARKAVARAISSLAKVRGEVAPTATP